MSNWTFFINSRPPDSNFPAGQVSVKEKKKNRLLFPKWIPWRDIYKLCVLLPNLKPDCELIWDVWLESSWANTRVTVTCWYLPGRDRGRNSTGGMWLSHVVVVAASEQWDSIHMSCSLAFCASSLKQLKHCRF